MSFAIEWQYKAAGTKSISMPRIDALLRRVLVVTTTGRSSGELRCELDGTWQLSRMIDDAI